MQQNQYVPTGVEVAAAWAWRLLTIAALGAVGIWLLRYFSEVTVPLSVGLLGAALAIGPVNWLHRHHVPRLLASMVVVVFLFGAFFAVMFLIGQQLSTQFNDVRANVVDAITQVQDWSHGPPLNLSDQQLQEGVDRVKHAIASSDSAIVSGATQIGGQVTRFLAGFFIVLFSMIFFLYEGNRIFSWAVALFPKLAREKAYTSGITAWNSLTSFMRATVLVALVDAVGIGFGAWLLGVPLEFAIAALVFLGGFVPIVGAFVSGLVAVMVALVSQGFWVAVLMLIVVIGVQQLESHVLQPFLMGRFVAVHPLAIIVAIAAGIVVAGVVGALISVPLAASLNGVVRHLAAEESELGDESEPNPA